MSALIEPLLRALSGPQAEREENELLLEEIALEEFEAAIERRGRRRQLRREATNQRLEAQQNLAVFRGQLRAKEDEVEALRQKLDGWHWELEQDDGKRSPETTEALREKVFALIDEVDAKDARVSELRDKLAQIEIMLEPDFDSSSSDTEDDDVEEPDHSGDEEDARIRRTAAPFPPLETELVERRPVTDSDAAAGAGVGADLGDRLAGAARAAPSSQNVLARLQISTCISTSLLRLELAARRGRRRRPMYNYGGGRPPGLLLPEVGTETCTLGPPPPEPDEARPDPASKLAPAAGASAPPPPPGSSARPRPPAPVPRPRPPAPAPRPALRLQRPAPALRLQRPAPAPGSSSPPAPSGSSAPPRPRLQRPAPPPPPPPPLRLQRPARALRLQRPARALRLQRPARALRLQRPAPPSSSNAPPPPPGSSAPPWPPSSAPPPPPPTRYAPRSRPLPLPPLRPRHPQRPKTAPESLQDGDEYGDPIVVVEINKGSIDMRQDPARNFVHPIPQNPESEIAAAFIRQGGNPITLQSGHVSKLAFTFTSRQQVIYALARLFRDPALAWALHTPNFDDVAKVLDIIAVKKGMFDVMEHMDPFNL
eukprot:tig00000144_g8997.t1